MPITKEELARIRQSFEATRYLLQCSGGDKGDVMEKVMYAQDVGILLAEVERLRDENTALRRRAGALDGWEIRKAKAAGQGES